MPLPKIDYKTLKPGDTVNVKVGNHMYKTVIDPQGVQRFQEPIPGLDDMILGVEPFDVDKLRPYKGLNKVVDYVIDYGYQNLNQLAIAYHNKAFPKLDYAEFNMMLGYSVCGWRDLSNFEDMEIDNPIWSSHED